MDKRTTVGIDLAKDVFAICVLDARGAVLDRKVLRRAAFERWAASLPPSDVVMEACGSAHHWGRFFAARGHTARLIAAEFVVAFRKGGKNDGNDAEAIAIAARQPPCASCRSRPSRSRPRWPGTGCARAGSRSAPRC